MIRKKISIMGTTKDRKDRVYVAIKKNGNLIVQIKASEDDINNISNYSLNCVTNIQSDSKKSMRNMYFNSYVKYISDDYDSYNEVLNRFISRFVYACRVKDIILNNYTNFIKNKVMFSYYFEVNEIYENDKLHKFKV